MTFFDVLSLVGGIALFLYGMDVLGKSLEKAAGSQLKSILSKLTNSTIKGLLLGVAVTAVIQSSAATTVMVVGFVNAGTYAAGAGCRRYYGCKHRNDRHGMDSQP